MELSLYNCINFKLSRAQVSIHQIFRNNLNQFSITPGQYMVLCCLWESKEPLSAAQIAQMINLEASTTVGLLDRLEFKNLVTREASTTDGRVMIIRLTEKGRSLQKDVARVIRESNESVLKGFTKEERALLSDFLARLTN